MKEATTLKLIDGIFSPKETLDILLNLYNDKIKYHELKNFSSLERFSKEDPNAAKRIPELKKEVEKIHAFLSGLNEKKDQIVIESSVNICFKTME